MKPLRPEPIAKVLAHWSHARRHITTSRLPSGDLVRAMPTACPQCGHGRLAQHQNGAWQCPKCEAEGRA